MDKNDLWNKIVKEHLLFNVYKEVSVESDTFSYQVAFDV